MTKKRRLLIVDDSPAARQLLEGIFGADERFSLMESAENPYVAAERIAKETPDVITLDIEMPRMNGLIFLRKIMRQRPIPVIVITGKNARHVEQTVEALYEGAVDVIDKKELNHQDEEQIKRICDKVYEVSFSRLKRLAPLVGARNDMFKPGLHADKPSKIVLIGASSGGTRIIGDILSQLKSNIPPLVIVQHMSENFTKTFATQLNARLDLHVVEAKDGDELRNGKVYIAPGNMHLEIDKRLSKYFVRLNQDEAVNHVRPSVDVMFYSMSRFEVNNVFAFLLTGMGRDGARGLLELNKKGAFTVAQDEESSIIFGMPREAIRLGAASEVMNPKQIADFINKLL